MKINNKIILASVLLSLVMGLGTSCKKYLDTNNDPTKAGSVEPKLLFAYGITAWSANRMGGDSYIPIAFMLQSIADGGSYGFDAGNVYDLSTNSLNNVWRMYYATAGNNLQLALKQAEAANQPNVAAQIKVVLANMIYENTSLFGDVPFTEAWNSAFPYPKFDPQKTVMEGALKMLDDALAGFNESDPVKISDYDVYYAGNIASWKRLANGLKFRILMTMVDADPSKAAAIGTMLTSPGDMTASPSDNWLFKYKTTTNNENPKNRFLVRFGGGANIFFFAHNNVLDLMKPVNDPRIPIYFDKPASAATYIGVDTREVANAQTATISAFLYRKDAPDVILSYQEILFLQAEAYARGIGVTKNLATANTLYRKAIEEACKFYGVAAGTATTFANSFADLAVVPDPVRAIHLQQWVDLMDRPLEAFVVWRRSGTAGNEVPTLTLPPDAPAGPLIRRFTYPTDAELNSNVNKPSPLPLFTDKVWFDL